MSIFSIRKKFISIQFLFLCVASFLMVFLHLEGNVLFLFIYSIWNIFSYTFLFLKELRNSKQFHPFILLAFVSAWYMGVNGLSLVMTILSGDRIFFGATPIDHYVSLGILFMALEHILLFGTFYFFERKYYNKNGDIYDNIIKSDINYFKWAKNIYIIVWIFRVIGFVVDLSGITNVLLQISKIGPIISLYYLLFSYIKTGNRRYLKIHWVIALVEIILVINHGMKEEILQVIIPYCIYSLVMYMKRKLRVNISTVVKIGLLGFFVVGFVFPYVNLLRSISNEKGLEWTEVSTMDVLDEYWNYLSSGSNKGEKDSRGVEYAMSRAGSIACNTFSLDFVAKEGSSPLLLAYFAIGPIPRLIWPGKPRIVAGGMATRLAAGESDWMDPNAAEDEKNSVTLGYIGSSIVCFGYVIGIVWVFLTSIFVWYVWHNIQDKIHSNLLAIWLFIFYIANVYKDFDSFYDCGISYIVISSVYLFLMKKVFTPQLLNFIHGKKKQQRFIVRERVRE